MAWHSGKPVLADTVAAATQYIRENFAELADARIVDHNLDVADPPNGWYVRFANGWQICFGIVDTVVGDGTSDPQTGTNALPAEFSHSAAAYGRGVGSSWQYDIGLADTSIGDSITSQYMWRGERLSGNWTQGITYKMHIIAVGRWK